MRVDIKPLSQNKAWIGKLRKTTEHRKYINDLFMLLPKFDAPMGKLEVVITWGFSSVASDIDNPTKTFLDVLQLKYGFNDKNIYKLVLNKECVKRGKEFIEFEIKDF